MKIDKLKGNKFLGATYLPSPQEIVCKVNEIIEQVNYLERFVEETLADMVLYGTKTEIDLENKILPDYVMKEITKCKRERNND